MTPPPRQFTGDDPLVDPLNRMLRNQIENTVLDSEDIKWARTSKGVKAIITSTAEPGGGFAERFHFLRQYKDYTVCKRYTADLASDIRGIHGSDAEAEVRIAKPDEIKTSNWDYIARGGSLIGSVDGYRYAHSAPDGKEREVIRESGSEFGAASISYQQEIFPKYIAGESLILAMKVKQGSLMRITEEDGQAVNFTVDYIELPGRVFINKERKIRVCIEGSSGPWFALFRPSGAFQEE